MFWVIPGYVVHMMGVYGQHVWVDYDANMVIAKQSSNPQETEAVDLEYSKFLSTFA
jgi:hypothetical protein